MLHDYMKCEFLALKAIPGFSINSCELWDAWTCFW